jgi:cell division protein ZapA (FtsZ GTPase activity inhibitor)
MSYTIDVNIGSRSYKLNVEDGQEARVRSVAEHFDSFVQRMQASGGSGMERDRVLVMAGIMMADEFFSLRQNKEMDEKALDTFHNTLADRLEKLMPTNA